MRLLLILLYMCLPLVVSSQTETLLRIQGKDIPKSDFENYWRALPLSDKEMGKEYCFEQYLFRRLKIADGMAAGWHRQPAFVLRCRVEVGKRWKNMFVHKVVNDSLARSMYVCDSNRFSEHEWLKVRTITIPLPQNADKRAEARALARLDSIYRSLEGGEDFANYSQGEARWFPAYRLLREVFGQLSVLPVGGYSKPFVSPVGVHIVKLEERKDKLDEQSLLSFARMCAENESRAIRLGLPYNIGVGSKADSVSDAWYKELCQSVSDSLLVSLWDSKNGLTKESKPDSAAVESFFNENRQKYGWTLPHFKGAVVHCASKSDASSLKKRLKKLPIQHWQGEVEQWNSVHPDALATIEIGLFQIGKNPYVDKLAFKCGELPVHSGYTFVQGKHLKKGPETCLDVYGKVEKDYSLSEKRSMIAALKSRFDVEIDQDVLKTVNCGGDK